MSDSLSSDARVFAVASGKGGVGKTTTAVNVGATLASDHEVVVVDADLGMANLSEFLGLSVSGPTLQDVLSDDAAIEQAIYESHAGMAVVPGSSDLASYGTIDPTRLREVVEFLKTEFEYVLLDVGAGLHYESALPIGLSDAVVLVTTPWTPAARDTAKTRELAERIDATVAGVAITRLRGESSELAPDRVSEIVGAPVLTTVPEDDAARKALQAGQPVTIHAPNSLAARAYHALAATLSGAEPADQPATPTPDDEPSSLEELLEREADRSDDAAVFAGDREPADEGDSVSAESLGDPLAEPALEIGSDVDSIDESGPEDATEGESSVAVSSTEDAPVDNDDADPMADIPRLDENEEFTRGSEDGESGDSVADSESGQDKASGSATDPLADPLTDPLADSSVEESGDSSTDQTVDPVDSQDEGSDEGDEGSDEREESKAGEETEENGENGENGENEEGKEGEAGAEWDHQTEEYDEAAMIEVDDEQEYSPRKKGLLGRLIGLFR